MTASLSPVAARPALSRDLVRLGVGEIQRIGRREALVVLGPVTVEQHPQPLGRAQPEVVGALRTDVEIGREVLVVDDLRAAGTLDPEALRDPARLRFPWRRSACGPS